MAQEKRTIKRRIKSITSTRKITKAMELVSAAKMRKSVSRVLLSRRYADLAWQLVKNLSQDEASRYHQLLAPREKIQKVALVLISSNRGLCGVFNNQVVAEAVNFLKEQNLVHASATAEVILLGKKGSLVKTRYGQQVTAEFIKPDVTSQIEEILSLAKMLLTDYLEGKYDLVAVAYTDYVSSLKQEARVKKLLPIEQVKDEFLGVVSEQQTNQTRKETIEVEYLFEPNRAKVLDEILPKLIETQIYQAVLESDASEHSARMMAMRNASDAASDLIFDLTLSYNQARQAGITQEIAEISTAKVAMEKNK